MPTANFSRTRSTRGKSSLPSKPGTSTISNFIRVSKIQTPGKEAAKQALHSAVKIPTSTVELVNSRKRKAEPDYENRATARAANLCRLSTGLSKRTRQEEPRLQSIESHVNTSTIDISPFDDDKENVCKEAIVFDTGNARPLHHKRRRGSDLQALGAGQPEALLERLNLQSPPRKRSRQTALDAQSGRVVDQLPEELIGLLSLQGAFLKALSLQHAHNGTNVPVDIRILCPSIAQSWGKRRVTLDDIKRCVGVLTWKRPRNTSAETAVRVPLFLSDYGRGKICVELDMSAGSGPIDADRLDVLFEKNLRLLWSARKESDARLFISSLPKATPRISAKGALLPKGQTTLDEFKKGIEKKQQETQEAKARVEPALNSDGSRMSLLDRIRIKELQQSQASPPPSPAELQRRAALQRVDDVAGVIGMLSIATAAGRARISFTMASILTKLKDSLRTPISQEEGACCVRLLATEVAPQWVRVVPIGGKENVVIQTTCQPSKADIQAKVRALAA